MTSNTLYGLTNYTFSYQYSERKSLFGRKEKHNKTVTLHSEGYGQDGKHILFYNKSEFEKYLTLKICLDTKREIRKNYFFGMFRNSAFSRAEGAAREAVFTAYDSVKSYEIEINDETVKIERLDGLVRCTRDDIKDKLLDAIKSNSNVTSLDSRKVTRLVETTYVGIRKTAIKTDYKNPTKGKVFAFDCKRTGEDTHTLAHQEGYGQEAALEGSPPVTQSGPIKSGSQIDQQPQSAQPLQTQHDKIQKEATAADSPASSQSPTAGPIQDDHVSASHPPPAAEPVHNESHDQATAEASTASVQTQPAGPIENEKDTKSELKGGAETKRVSGNNLEPKLNETTQHDESHDQATVEASTASVQTQPAGPIENKEHTKSEPEGGAQTKGDAGNSIQTKIDTTTQHNKSQNEATVEASPASVQTQPTGPIENEEQTQSEPEGGAQTKGDAGNSIQTKIDTTTKAISKDNSYSLQEPKSSIQGNDSDAVKTPTNAAHPFPELDDTEKSGSRGVRVLFAGKRSKAGKLKERPGVKFKTVMKSMYFMNPLRQATSTDRESGTHNEGDHVKVKPVGKTKSNPLEAVEALGPDPNKFALVKQALLNVQVGMQYKIEHRQMNARLKKEIKKLKQNNSNVELKEECNKVIKNLKILRRRKDNSAATLIENSNLRIGDLLWQEENKYKDLINSYLVKYHPSKEVEKQNVNMNSPLVFFKRPEMPGPQGLLRPFKGNRRLTSPKSPDKKPATSADE